MPQILLVPFFPGTVYLDLFVPHPYQFFHQMSYFCQKLEVHAKLMMASLFAVLQESATYHWIGDEYEKTHVRLKSAY